MEEERRRFAELHLHLDGAITTEIAQKLATMQEISLPYETTEQLEAALSVPKDCTSLNDFLKCFSLPCSLLQTKEAISEAVYLVQENIRKQGVVYAEIRFAPQLHLEQGLSQEEVVLAALSGLKKSTLRCNLILCCMRMNDNREQNEETIHLADKYLIREESEEDYGVVAIDLAGAEGMYPTEEYADLFEKVRQRKIPFTIHAGEADGAQSVWSALQFGATRIGHGVRSIEDEALLKKLAQSRICVEMCPTSNLQTRAISHMDEFPILQFIKAGIPVTVNTDDMAICRTTMKEEMDLVQKNFGLTEKQEEQIFVNAICHSFAKEKIKKEILEVV